MEFNVLTLFPEMFVSPLRASILKKAQEREIIRVLVHNLRDYAPGRHQVADDYPYGGGGGMVLKAEPMVRALEDLQLRGERGRVILLSPQGKLFTQEKARELALLSRLILICGHYEGVDERVSLFYADEEISIGDYVLTGGEFPAMVLIDAVARLVPQVVGCGHSVEEDSFYGSFLDYPHYTRPVDFRGLKVPEVLLSGNHQAILRWRRKEALRRTWQRRPMLLKEDQLSSEDLVLLREIRDEAGEGNCFSLSNWL